MSGQLTVLRGAMMLRRAGRVADPACAEPAVLATQAHGRPRTHPLSRREAALDPRAGEDDRHDRRLAELEPAELLRHEVPAGQGLSRDPGQSGHRRAETA